MWKGENFLKLLIKYNEQKIIRILKNYSLNRKITTVEKRDISKEN